MQIQGGEDDSRASSIDSVPSEHDSLLDPPVTLHNVV